MKKVKLLLVLTLLFTININSQESDYVKPIDRSIQPKQGETPTIDLKKPTIFTLKDGLTVIVVENKKLPTFSVRISIYSNSSRSTNTYREIWFYIECYKVTLRQSMCRRN